MGKSGFKMNGSPMQRNFGIGSPLLGKKEDKFKQKSYNEVTSSVTKDMTDEQLREIAVKQHLDKDGDARANKYNVSFDHLKALRNAKNKSSEKKVTTKSSEEVVAPATLQESRDSYYNREAFADEGWFADTPAPTEERRKVLAEARKSGYMRDLTTAVEKKYGKELHEIDDPVDRQMAGDAMIDEKGNILPMSSPSGQYSGPIEKKSPLYKGKKSRGFVMKRNRK